VKRTIVILAATAGAAFMLFRPGAAPPPASTGWAAVDPSASAPRARRARRDDAASPSHALAYVAGDVVRPGVYAVGEDARVRDAIALAGGTRPDADLLAVNLAAHVRDGDAVVVPARGERASRPSGRRTRRPSARMDGGDAPRARAKHHRSRHRATAPAAVVDINSADADALAGVPGIGEGLAERIVEFRRENGAFASVDELLDVAGITEHRLDAMIPYVVAR